MSDVVWHGQQVLFAVRAKAGARINAAGIHLKNRIREKLSRSQPTAGKGIRKRGLQPSLPGEYPKLVTGHLRRNIQSEFNAAAVVSRVGTNVLYGRHMELGTSRMAARPFLANAIRDFAAELRQIIESGKVPGGGGE